MRNFFIYIILAFIASACTEVVKNPQQIDSIPDIFPDYSDVTVPSSIAPLNFSMVTSVEKTDVSIECENGDALHLQCKNSVAIPESDWHKLLKSNIGSAIKITVSTKVNGQWSRYKPFKIYVSKDSIDFGLVYRLIAPGYEGHSKMGIYERNLSTSEQTVVFENTMIKRSCVNCHAFNHCKPSDFNIHIRGEHGATILQQNGQMKCYNSKNDSTLTGCVYPYWHPSGQYVAYSNNVMHQSFYSTKWSDIEVVDEASDVLVYDIERNVLIKIDILASPKSFENFPSFSPDGKTLYYTSAVSRTIPDCIDSIRFNLCAVDFNPATGQIGSSVDTLINAVSEGISVSMPRPSYDGRYIMYTQSEFGYFHLYHNDSDLWILDLKTMKRFPLSNVNSPKAESWHCWSSNSHWFAFVSKRIDGRFAGLYIAHIDENGEVSKPFLLPQKYPAEYYDELMMSYNCPEFVDEKLNFDYRQATYLLLNGKRVNMGFEHK